jgi:FeS assembly SUF system protein
MAMMYDDNPLMAGFEGVPELDEDGVARAGAPLAPGMPIAEREALVDAIRTVYDPEIPVNIYELGLVYEFEQKPDGDVKVTMTLTAPGCPVAGVLPGKVAEVLTALPGVGRVEVHLTWEPMWEPSMMSEAARVELDMF